MKTSDRGIKLIKSYEGLRLQPYKCPAGKLTVGWGHLILDSEKHLMKGITLEEAENIFKKDLSVKEVGVSKLVKVPLSQGQLDALISFSFNLGIGALASSTLLRKLNKGDYIGASKEFKRWVYADGKKLPGLVARRKKEEDIFNGK